MPSTKRYTITSELFGVSVPLYCEHRRQLPAARRELREQVYNAFRGVARLDSLDAWHWCKRADDWNGEDPFFLQLGELVVTATGSVRHASH